MSMTHTPLTHQEERMLEIIQTGFPICSEPYVEIAAALGCLPDAACALAARLRKQGLIRRIGGSFDARKMGYVSTLVAARVLPVHLEAAAAHVSSFLEVTHNYERANRYNLWFTIIAFGHPRLETILQSIRQQEGVLALHELPALKTFKIKVDFKFSGEHGHAGSF